MSKEFEDINLDDYKNIEVEINDIKKAKMKKNLRGKIIKRNRKNKKSMVVAASVTLIMTVGILSQPVIAESIPILNTIYKQLGFSEKYLPVSKYVGKSVEENGIKVTVDTIVVTEHIIKAAIKVESEKEIFKNPTDTIHITGEINGIDDGSSGGWQNVDGKTQIRVIELHSSDRFPATGVLKFNIFSEEYEVNTSLEMDIDFTDSYKNNFKKEVEMASNNGEDKIVELEATALGTVLKVEKYDLDRNGGFLLKLDDNIYSCNGAAWGNVDETYVICPEALYDDVKKAKNISVIGYEDENGSPWRGVNDVNEESEKSKEYYEEEYKKEELFKDTLPKINKDNIESISELTSQDGNKVYVSNVERTDEKIKVYINGDEKNDVLRVINSMTICDENNENYQMMNKIIENDTGYIVEFDNMIEGKIKVVINDILSNKKGLIFKEEVKLTLK